MIIANTSAQLQDLILLTQFMGLLQSDEAVFELGVIMNKCGYDDGNDIVSVETAALQIDGNHDPMLVVTFKFDGDNNENPGTFYVRVKNGAVTGDY